MNIATLALRNLLRRPARTLLLLLSVGLAIGTALALMSLSDSIENTSYESARERGADFTVTQKGGSDFFQGFVDVTLGPKIVALPGVAGVAGELAMFAPVDGENTFITFGMAEESYFWPAMPLTEGRLPAPGERFVAVLGQQLANVLEKKTGDTITVFDHPVQVIGVNDYQSGVNRGSLMMRLQDLQELAFREGQVTVFHVALQPGQSDAQIETIKQSILALAPVTIAPTDQLLARDRNVKVLKAISTTISIIALFTAGLSVLNVLLMAVQERIRETGIMMAIGWSDRRIMAMIVLEGMIIGLAGAIVGIPLGFVACSFFSWLPTIGTYLSFAPSSGIIAISVLGALALATLGSLYPAWRAVSHTPAEALRRA
ncbi:MAG: ABC transporter permease [Hyphomicrobiaceae bacterium]